MQVNAQLGVYNNLLSLPSDQRDDKGVKAIAASIDALRTQRAIRPAPGHQSKIPGLCRSGVAKAAKRRQDQGDARRWRGDAVKVRSRTRREASFVWAVPKDGPMWRFAAVPATSRRDRNRVPRCRKLREALEPEAPDDCRHPAVRPRARLRAVFAAAETGRGRMESPLRA